MKNVLAGVQNKIEEMKSKQPQKFAGFHEQNPNFFNCIRYNET